MVKKLTLDEDAYNRLKKAKRKNENFSDAIMRLVYGEDWKKDRKCY